MGEFNEILQRKIKRLKDFILYSCKRFGYGYRLNIHHYFKIIILMNLNLARISSF